MHELGSYETMDNILWNDPVLNTAELDEMIEEMGG